MRLIDRPTVCVWGGCFRRLTPRNRTCMCGFHRRLQLYMLKRRGG